MASKPTVTLTFAGDEAKLTKSMAHVGVAAKDMETKVGSASSDMAKKAGSAGDFMSRTFSTAAGQAIANFSSMATTAAMDFFKGMVSEAREAEKVTASTAQGIKTIGAESWTSAQAVGDLAESISNKIGVDDELIQSSANLLLTFKNIKNAAGENNDIFDRAVMASQDLAAKGFGDAESAAKMLGKALNDPVKGITALGKAGVTFTQEQKDQIAAMVESGDILGAQKIIMAELEAQVGGTAEATATAGDRMATTWANFQENLGAAVLPILDTLLGKLGGILEWASQNPEIVMAIGAITAGIWLLNAALNANPIVLVISLIAALVVALIALWNNSASFRQFFIDMWNGIQGVVGGVAQWIQDRWNGLMNFFQSIPAIFGSIGSSAGEMIKSGFKGAINWIVDRLNWVVDQLNKVIGGLNHVNPFSDIPPIPKIPKLHTGGVVPGMLGEEQLMMLQAGERVVPRGQAGNTGVATIAFRGDTDGAFATAFQNLVRTGVITIEVA